MSDRNEDLSRQYMENVWETHSRSVGLFPIPEYPEFEAKPGMWSTALDVLLTTLRYIAPATILTLFWGQQSFLFKLLKYIDSAVRSLIFSNEEQKHAVLQWLGEAGPVRVDKLEVVWRHGWIVCGVLDAALPGACTGHPPTRLSLKHAQSIADDYLGVEPVFSRHELDTHDTLSRHQEWKLVNYLESIRLALSRLTPPTPTNKLANTSPEQKVKAEEITHFTLDYIARGSGLVAAQPNHKVHFKIYPTAQQSLDPGEINILIQGPKGTYGTTVLPPILGKAQMIRQNLLGLQAKTCYTEKVLPITQGTTYLRSYGSNDMHKTFYIPKTKYDIDIEVEVKQDHVRIGYVASLEGKYEISITSGGQNVVGSPFKVTVSNNIVGTLERDSFCLEDGEEIDIVDVKTDRKVVLRIVDFVTEKMLLNENGTFEKISDEEARYLMQTENVNVVNRSIGNLRRNSKEEKNKPKSKKFYRIAKTVLTLCRVCKNFQTLHNNKTLDENKNTESRNKHDIPDILNSTIYEGELKSHSLLKNRRNQYAESPRVIVPEKISVSLMTERPKAFEEENKLIDTSDMNVQTQIDSLENFNILKLDRFEDDSSTISVDTVQSNNPFVSDIYDQNFTTQKGLRPLMPKEYETHNLQSEEIENLTPKLFIDSQLQTNNQHINLFNNVTELVRPKSPDYKIISREVTNLDDSVYFDPGQTLLTDESTCSTLTNPFLKHGSERKDSYHEKPDFIIGAPVSLPPSYKFVSSSKTNIERLPKENEKNYEENKKTSIQGSIEFSTQVLSVGTKDHIDDNYSSLDSNKTQDIILISSSSPTPTVNSQSLTSRETSPRKDTWDSAYVSIDDSNCLTENNASETTPETYYKRKSPQSEDLSKMGSAEREIWQSDTELKDISYADEDYSRLYKHDLRRPEFTPILEENERNVTFDMKEDTYRNRIDNDSMAGKFFEMNDLYDDELETLSVSTNQDHKLQNLGFDYTLQGNDICVDSASERADVKRHTKMIEGEISEVQVNATESFSVSPTLHVNMKEHCQEKNNNDEIQFCDRNIYSNIVLEKKRYWDDKVRQIEAKSEEIRLMQNKRRITSKHLRRNDSISKRKGKKIVHQLLKSSPEDYDTHTESKTDDLDLLPKEDNIENNNISKISEYKTDESNKSSLSCFGTKSVDNKGKKSTKEPIREAKVSSSSFDDVNVIITNQVSNSTVDLKPEVSEKVFQAFETSPKRFFGTSRKHILNKIDTFLGSHDEEKIVGKDNSEVNHESGLVSSRISLFHTISQTEELPRPRRKSTSMHNINSNQNGERTVSLDRINQNSKEKSNIFANENSCSTQLQESPTTLREKRARLLQSTNNKSFDETLCSKPCNIENTTSYVQTTIKDLNKQNTLQFQFSTNKLKSMSKSEMDIFNKTTLMTTNEDLDKHKSYEELPKVSVKTFISLYEDVSKTLNNYKSTKTFHLKKPGSSNNKVPISTKGTTTKLNTNETPVLQLSSIVNPDQVNSKKPDANMKIHMDQDINHSPYFKPISTKDKEGKHLSLSDIDLEIVDNSDLETQKTKSSPDQETVHLDYKNRFSKAKQFFQSLEELREERRLKNKLGINHFEHNSSIESLEDDKRPRKRSKIKKSNSLPSSEIAKAWNQLQENKEEGKKLVKISEKFNVDDLFEDVMDGRLSRQGSLRGIPHKKAVLQTFKSMENVADSKLNSYEMAESQLNDFAKENKIRNAQTYLTEYPYLPMTDPSKYYSRLDVNATGLITFKELKKIPRRNSVPDLKLNTTFTADL